MGRRITLLLLTAALAAPPSASARGANNLLRVVTPVTRSAVSAHPFVNVIIGFGTTDAGVPADPATLRVRLGRIDVTPLFRPTHDERGAVSGMRAELGPALLRIGLGGTNRLRFDVRSPRDGRGRTVRDVDRVRFRAADAANQPPEAVLVVGEGVILPGIPLQFDASGSTDADGDELTYEWDFGDGSSASGARPRHVFAATDEDVTVRLTVRDHQDGASGATTLLAVPPICPGCTPGVLRVEAPEGLEFGAVPTGSTASRTLTLRNTAGQPTSQVAVRLGVDGAGFAIEPPSLELGPGESAPVTLSFSPAAEGHSGGELTFVAAATNQSVVHMLSHAYGGSAPGTGPLSVASPVFHNVIGRGTEGILPSGARFVADSIVHLCRVPNNGPGTGDLCVTDADCAANGGTCPTTATCIRGERAGQPCSAFGDCPGGICPAAVPFEPADMCGDGSGALYLMSDEGTYTDTNLTRETALAGSLLRLEFDATGQRTFIDMLTRVTEETTQLACDGTPAAAGGRLYIAEYHNVVSPGDCFRDARESLTTIRKSRGGDTVLMPRIDATAGLPECEDYEPVTDLEVARDGSAVFASHIYGLYRIRPTTLLMTPDVDDFFQVHPDGSVIVVTARDEGTSGLVRVYKISTDQAVNGAPLIRDLIPCATITVPNNRSSTSGGGRTSLASFAVDRVHPATFDATVLVSFFTSGGNAALASNLLARGTVAVFSPAGSNSCSVQGLVNLEAVDQLTF